MIFGTPSLQGGGELPTGGISLDGQRKTTCRFARYGKGGTPKIVAMDLGQKMPIAGCDPKADTTRLILNSKA
ncbi:MAG: hypothetical protein EOS28_32105 [Mesorhizobium sp.]|nr:MAG: hypothetical protein EOS28_32105 [Mesorhizobium sp.]